MRKVFVDTSAFVALRDRADRDHPPARAMGAELTEEGLMLFTSNYVFAETYTALLVRAGRDEAISWGRAFHATTAVELVRVDEEMEDAAWSILETHADKRWSYVDATSFALMGRDGVREAFTFDRNFAQRGLAMLPGPRS